MCNNGYRRNLPARQSGAVLIIGLIMLLLMTIIGLSAIRGSNMQELMAGNMRDRQVSFQAAEAGLRQGEILVNGVGLPDTSDETAGLIQALQEGGSLDFWFSYNWDNDSVETDLDLLIEAEKVRFVIEQLDVAPIPGADGSGIDVISQAGRPDLIFYRITGRGVGMTNNTETFLQSLFRRQ